MSLIILMILSAQLSHASSVSVIITEIGAQEASDYEWVEIYNQSDSAVDMTSWKFFEDNAKHGLKASQGDMIIESKEYAIIANVPAKFIEHHPGFTGTIIDSSWSSLKESGELIGLIDNNVVHVDEFTYSTVSNTSLQRVLPDLDTGVQWISHVTFDSAGRENEFEIANIDIGTQIDTNADSADSTNADNADMLNADNANADSADILNADNGNADSADILNADNANADSADRTNADNADMLSTDLKNVNKIEVKTNGVVKSAVNNGGSSSSSSAKKPKVVKEKVLPTVLLSEIFPNPYGSDAIYEFFELENVSDKVQSIKGWKFKTLKQEYIFGDIKIQPYTFYQILRSESGIALNNKKESIQLINELGKVIDKFKYSDEVPENSSYVMVENTWKLSSIPTRGGTNIYMPLNTAPEIVAKCFKGANDQNILICDASDTTDPDNDQLSFRWNMRNKDDQILYYWEDDYFEEPYETFKSGTLELIVSDAKHKVSKSISIPRRGETIVNIQGVKNIVPQTEIKKVEKKKAVKKSMTKKKAAVKKSSVSKSYTTTAQGLVIVPPDKDRKKMTIEFPGIVVSSPRGRLPDVKIGDEVKVRGRFNPTSHQITISVAEDVSVIFHHAPPQPITVTSQDDLKKYMLALVSIEGQAEEIYDSGFKLASDEFQIPVYLPAHLHASPERFENQDITVSGIIKKYRNAPELVPRSVDDIKITSVISTPEPGHKTVNQFLNVWRDWRVGTTLAIVALMTLLSWRVRRLVPAAMRVDAMAEDRDKLIIPKHRAIGGRPPSIMLE